MQDTLRFTAKALGLYGTARDLDVINKILWILGHRSSCATLRLPVTSGEDILEADLDEKFVANLEYLLRVLQHLLLDRLVHIVTELLTAEALCRTHLLDDGIFAERPRRLQQISTSWPWCIRASLIILWGVCWMFYEPWLDQWTKMEFALSGNDSDLDLFAVESGANPHQGQYLLVLVLTNLPELADSGP